MTVIPTPFPTPILAPSVVAGDAYRQIAYVSASNYRLAPTSVPTNSLAATGTANQAAASTAALSQVILRASAWADEICFHRGDGTLAASVTTEHDWITVKPDGSLAVICNFKPILGVIGMALGPGPANMASLDQQAANLLTWGLKTIYLPGTFSSMFGSAPVLLPYPSFHGQIYAVWQYLNGFPHMALAASCTQGATSITVIPAVPDTSPQGVVAGTTLWIKDSLTAPQNFEMVTVTAAPTSNVLAVTATKYAHTVPTPPTQDFIPVTALPYGIEQATISLTSILLKAPGFRATTMGNIGSKPARQAAGRAGVQDDWDVACKNLKPYVVAYLHN